jgi:imidazolonepropionase-like amidohydrolase
MSIPLASRGVSRIVFAGGRIFDGTGAAPAPGDLAVEGDRIVDVGAGLEGDESVSVDGCTLLPGLIDSHVHLGLIGISNVQERLQLPWSYPYFAIPGNALATLRCGITTVRDAGGLDAGARRAQQDGLFPGPRMQVSLALIHQTGGHGYGSWPSGDRISLLSVSPGLPDGTVDGADAMRRKVRELVDAGADVLKVATSGGVLSYSDEPHHSQFQRDEIDALVLEAAATGRWVMAHAQSTSGIRNAVEAGVRSIEHGVHVDDATLELMRERGTWLVPTLVAIEGVLARGDLPARVLDKALAIRDVHREAVTRAHAAGVRIAFGTDCPVSPHGTNLRELALLAEVGLTADEALTAATSSAAELLGRDDLGILAPGRRADVVVLRGDIRDLSTFGDRVEQVWMDGVRVV